MSMYEDYDGSEQPTKRPVPYSGKPRRHRTAWMFLILLYMSGCSYWGWQVFLRPDGEFAGDQESIIVAETDTLVADAHANSRTASLIGTDSQPAGPSSPPVAPSSKPSSVRAQKRKKSGRPLDKMEAETGLIYETDRASPASKQTPQRADHEGLGTQTDRADPDSSVEIDYPNAHKIHQKDIPPASQAKRGVIVEQTEVEPLPEPAPEIEPDPLPLPEPGLVEPLPPIYEEETAPEVPPIGQEVEIVVLSETTAPTAPPAQPVVYVEPTPVIIAPPPFHPEFDYDGRFVVQIATFSNVEVACSVWDDLRYQHPVLFGDAETIVRPHRSNSGRLLHRLRVGAFSKRQHAVDWCIAYKDVGGECFVTRR